MCLKSALSFKLHFIALVLYQLIYILIVFCCGLYLGEDEDDLFDDEEECYENGLGLVRSMLRFIPFVFYLPVGCFRELVCE